MNQQIIKILPLMAMVIMLTQINAMSIFQLPTLSLNIYDIPHANWTDCMNRWAPTLGSFAHMCEIPDHVIDELVTTIEKYPKKSWQLYASMIKCGLSSTLSESILLHVEKCLK